MKKDQIFPTVGTVVKSCAGRDRKRVFIVVGTVDAPEGRRLLVSDGRLRGSDTPKSKNPLHVKPVAHLTESECEGLKGADDETVRELLKRYDSYCSDGMPEVN